MKKLLLLLLLPAILFGMETTEYQNSATADTVKTGELVLGASLNINYMKSDGADDAMTDIGIGHNLPISYGYLKNLNTFHPAGGGLNLSYGLSDDLQVGATLPLFSHASYGDNSVDYFFGQPSIFLIKTIDSGSTRVQFSPYLTLPFLHMMEAEHSDADNNFDQAMAGGVNIVATVARDQQIGGEFLVNIHYTAEKDDHKDHLLMMLGGWAKYALNEISSFKIGLLYLVPDLTNDHLDFNDGGLNLDIIYSTIISSNLALEVNAWYGLPIITEGYKELTTMGLNIGFKRSF